MEELLKKAISGDKDALSLIFLYLQKDLYKIAIYKTRNKEDALDAIQETIYITYTNLKNIQSINSFPNWIKKVLVNECYKILSKKNKTNTETVEVANLYELEDSRDISSIDKLESNIQFYELIKCLNDKEKTIMILYYINEYTTKEISKILEIKENTIKSIIKRGKNKIKNNLKGGNYD